MARASRQQRWWKGAWALVAALSLLASTVVAGHRYFTCAWMTGVALEPCCHHGATDSQPTIDAEACCHARHFASPDPGLTTAPGAAIAAPLLAIVLVPTRAAGAPVEAPPVDIRWARAGPAPGSPNDYRIRLRVSLT